MTTTELLITIAALVLATALTRFIPFMLFPAGKPTPPYVRYLGKMLPGAALGMLVIYCLKGINFAAAPHGLPELIASACVVALHIWKRSTLLSIAAGTVIYMLLVQFVF